MKTWTLDQNGMTEKIKTMRPNILTIGPKTVFNLMASNGLVTSQSKTALLMLNHKNSDENPIEINVGSSIHCAGLKQ